MSSLSEKEKGKQRAVDASSEAPLVKDLTIRFTEGIPDLTLQVAEKDAVRDVKRNARCISVVCECCANAQDVDPYCQATAEGPEAETYSLGPAATGQYSVVPTTHFCGG